MRKNILTLHPAFFVLAAVLLAAPAGLRAGGWTFEELAEVYGAREEAMPVAAELEETLLAEAGELEPLQLWKAVVDPATEPRSRAALAIKLVRGVFPGGDPGRWDEVAGFWKPDMVPKPLAALDSVLYGAMALMELDEPGAPWLARGLLLKLRRSSRASLLAMHGPPAEYGDLVGKIDEATGLPPVGGWPAGESVGKLPLARPVRLAVKSEYALMRGMTFLNNSGQPVSGMGPFAWDRKKGAVYRVVFAAYEVLRWEMGW